MFDVEKFDAANFTFPTKKIPVPELKEFFESDDPISDDPVWAIRGLTGHELAIVNEAVETVNKKKAIIEALADGTNESLKNGIKTLLNKGDITPEDMARRLKMLELGSVNPECQEHIAVKLAHFKATTFYKLTNEIIRATGEGAELGE